MDTNYSEMSPQQLDQAFDDASMSGDHDALDAIMAAMDAQVSGAVEDPDLKDEPDVADPSASASSSASDGGNNPDPESSTAEPAAKEPEPEPGPEPDPKQEPAIATKKGDNTIPYEVLEQTRRENEQLKQQVAELTSRPPENPEVARELERLKRLNTLYQDQLKQHEIDPEALPEEFKLTAERLQELSEFGDVGKVVSQLAKQSEWLVGQLSRNNKIISKQEDQPAASAEVAELPVADVIKTDPDLSRWVRSELAWKTAQEVDEYVATLPEFEGKNFSDRKAKVVELTRQRLGEAAPAPSTNKQTKEDLDAKAAAAVAASTSVPSSLSEVHGQNNAEKSYLEQTSEMDEADIAEFMDRQMRAGKSLEQIEDMLLSGNHGL